MKITSFSSFRLNISADIFAIEARFSPFIFSFLSDIVFSQID